MKGTNAMPVGFYSNLGVGGAANHATDFTYQN